MMKVKKVRIKFADDSNLGGINEEKGHNIIADNLDYFKESNVRNETKSKQSARS